MLKARMVRSTFVALICYVAFTAHAMADAPKRIDVPPGELVVALEMLSRQAAVDLVFQPDQLKSFRTEGVSGTYSPQDAIRILLKGTPLQLRTDASSGAMVIAPPAAAKSVPLSDAGGDPAQPQTRVELEEVIVTGIPEMLVQGRTTLNSDIQRNEDDAQPYVVFDRAQIEHSQASNLEDFLKTRLPMNAVQGTASQTAGGTSMSSINLRGLGANQTLILVDGRRVPNMNVAGTFNQPDINGISLAAIERIEILPSTASGIYGGGATGGVINIITRQDYSGVDLSATYGNTFDTDTTNRRIDLNGGFNLEGGRTQVMFSASHASFNPLLVGDRDFAEKARDLQLANNPSAFYAVTTPPLGRTSNISSANGSNLRLKPELGGTQLNSSFTHVPEGYAGAASDRGAALAANAGQYNLELPEDLNGTQQSLLNDPELNSASLSLRREFGSRVDGFLGLAWTDNQGQSYSASVPSSVTLQPSAANNPFTTAIVVRFPATGLNIPSETQSESFRATGGVIVRLPKDWAVAADYVWSRSRYSFTLTSPVIGDPDGAGPAISGNTALSNGTLDVLRDLNASPLDYSPYLLPSPNSFGGPFDALSKSATVRLSGPLLYVPAGAVTLSGAVERRDEDAEDATQRLMTAAGGNSINVWPSRSQSVTAFYLETRVPIFSAANDRPWLRELEFQASARRDEYETTAPSPSTFSLTSPDAPFPDLAYSTNEVEATKFTLGLRYSPVADVMLRASYGTGFLPPSISQVAAGAPQTQPALTAIDPKRGGVASTFGPFTRYTGGNPALVPEDSESWSAGAVFTPQFLRGLRLSLDYTQIKKDNEITTLSFQQALDLEDLLPGRVKRAPLTAAEAALGYTGGVITDIDLTALNLSASRLEAVDIQADYLFQTERSGDFQFYAIGTWQPNLERQTVATTAFVEFAGFSNGVLEWRGNAGVTWQRGPLTLGWNSQYFDSYYVYASTAPEATIATAILSQGSDKVSSQIYHDLSARYRFDGSASIASGALSILADTEIRFGIENIFNESPPILASTGTNGGYSIYGDPRLRRFTLTVRKSF